jgi:hypothetical protein
MSTARYWRFRIVAVDGGAYASASEFQLYASSNGTGSNLALTGTPSQTGDGAVGPAYAANDGNSNSEAGSSFVAPGPYVWTIDLGTAEPVGSVGIVTQRVVPNRTARDFFIDSSTDGATWSTRGAFTNQTGWTEFERRVFDISASAQTTVAGTARDSSLNPIAGVTVRVHRRDTGDLLGVAVTSDGVGGPPTYTPIAGEGGAFSVVAGQIVRFGADTRWAEITFPASGNYGCNSGTFGGDPAYGTVKTCELVTYDPPLPIGRYSIDCGTYAGEVQAVFLDPDGGALFNDVIHRTFPVTS